MRKLWLVAALGLAGCAMPEQAASPSSPAAGEVMLAQVADDEAGVPTRSAAQGRRIIYQGTVGLEVDDLDATLVRARAAVEQAGGYLSGLSQVGGSRGRHASATYRVPAERFESTIDALAKLGTVLMRSVTADDVTEQWVDLDARLRNLNREEQRMLALLERAGTVPQLLEVERELSRVRGEAEQITAQLRVLKDRVAVSTITLELNLPAELRATADSGPWLKRALSGAAATFVLLGKALVQLLVYLIVLAPYAGLAALPVWLARRRRKG